MALPGQRLTPRVDREVADRVEKRVERLVLAVQRVRRELGVAAEHGVRVELYTEADTEVEADHHPVQLVTGSREDPLRHPTGTTGPPVEVGKSDVADGPQDRERHVAMARPNELILLQAPGVQGERSGGIDSRDVVEQRTGGTRLLEVASLLPDRHLLGQAGPANDAELRAGERGLVLLAGPHPDPQPVVLRPVRHFAAHLEDRGVGAEGQPDGEGQRRIRGSRPATGQFRRDLQLSRHAKLGQQVGGEGLHQICSGEATDQAPLVPGCRVIVVVAVALVAAVLEVQRLPQPLAGRLVDDRDALVVTGHEQVLVLDDGLAVRLHDGHRRRVLLDDPDRPVADAVELAEVAHDLGSVVPLVLGLQRGILSGYPEVVALPLLDRVGQRLPVQFESEGRLGCDDAQPLGESTSPGQGVEDHERASGLPRAGDGVAGQPAQEVARTANYVRGVLGVRLHPGIRDVAVGGRAVGLGVHQQVPSLVDDPVVVRDTDRVEQGHQRLELEHQSPIDLVDQGLDVRPGRVHPVDMDAVVLGREDLSPEGLQVLAVPTDPLEERLPRRLDELDLVLDGVVVPDLPCDVGHHRIAVEP